MPSLLNLKFKTYVLQNISQILKQKFREKHLQPDEKLTSLMYKDSL